MSQKIKIAAGMLTTGFIIVVLLIVNSFTGNPVSKALATKAAQQYIDANYSGLNSSVQLQLQGRCIPCICAVGHKRDTAFSIYSGSYGNILRDDYAYEVANNFTTFRRLDEELRKAAPEIVGRKLHYDFDGIFLNKK